MNLSRYFINKSEQKTRKHWLFSTVSFLVLYPIAIALLMFGASLSNPLQIFEDALITTVSWAMVGVVYLWIIWCCAYRKHGTRLLTWWLITGPIKMVFALLEPQEPYNWLSASLVWIEVILFLWWFMMSLQLRVVNKSLQQRILLEKRNRKKEKAYESVAKEAEKIMSEKIKAKYLPMSVEIEEGVDVAARVDQRLDELDHLSSKMTDGIGSDNVLKYLEKVEAEIRAVPVPNTEKKSVLKLIKEYKKKYRSGNYTPKQYIEQYRDINAENKKLYETKWLQGEQPETRKFYTGLQGEISKTIEEGTPQ